MGRTKGSKNKVKERGNPDFNLNSVQPSQKIGQDIAATAIMPEDLEFDRQLEALNAMPSPDIEPEPSGAVVKFEQPKRELLRQAIEDYKPAHTGEEIKNQIHQAKYFDCDSIEATLEAAMVFCRDKKSLTDVGYFIMHDIKVYIDGHYEKAQARDRQTIEQRNFGGSTVA